jgi:hypothetical protein
MRWNLERVQAVLSDLAAENPFACEALLSISKVQFSKRTPTLSVSIRRRPVLSINSDFLEQHVLTEMDLRTLFLHEFLHVLLNHTLRYKVNTPLLNLALDSIINSIIHRFFGTEYSDFFCRYYSTDGAMALLRPAAYTSIAPELRTVHGQVYRGEISADEVHELLEFLLGASLDLKGIEFLGGHDFDQLVSDKNKKILDSILQRINGVGIWNKYSLPGIGTELTGLSIKRNSPANLRWKKAMEGKLILWLTLADKPQYQGEGFVNHPMLNPADRSAYFRFLFGHCLPLYQHPSNIKPQHKTLVVYLDVSASMNQEIQALAALLRVLKSRYPIELYAFSDSVVPAFWNGKELKTQTSQGTNLDCVVTHFNSIRGSKALVVTDGYLPTPFSCINLKELPLFFVISSGGSTQFVQNVNLPYYQLTPLPQ